MPPSRVLKQIDIKPTDDAYTDEGNPTTNYGTYATLFVGEDGTANEHYIFMRIAVPGRPSDASKEYDTPYNYKLRVYRQGVAGAGNRTLGVYHSQGDDVAESSITWNNQPFELALINSQVHDNSTTGWFEIDLSSVLRDALQWGEVINLRLMPTSTWGSGVNETYSSKNGTLAQHPILRIEYYQTEPDNVESFAIEPDPNDATRPKLSWDPSDDGDFSHYEVWRKVGAGGWAQVGSDISELGTVDFIDTSGGLTENNVIYYRLRIERSDGSYNETDVWMIRPDISTFTVSDTTPDALQELTFSVAASVYPSTPTPVTNEWYEFNYGTSAQDDSSSARVRETSRKHRYPYVGSQTPKVQVENSLGFKSDLTQLTTGGPTLTVADINPVAIIKASPVKVAVNETIRFFGDESYCPAGNKELAAIGAYEWDKDYSVSFVMDDATTVPYKDYSWVSAGTKVVALRVKDEDLDYSTEVTIQVEVVTVTTVDLDSALVDGFEFIDADRRRTIVAQQGLEAKKVTRHSEEIVPVAIAGFAFTDSGGTAGIADDIETLEDVVANNKRVQIAVHGTTRYGALNLKTHTEGGWLGKYNWTAEIVLE